MKQKGQELCIFYGDEQIAKHTISNQKGQMVTDPVHFAGIPKPAYPSSIRAIREVFLAHFPESNPFIDGLVKTRYGNAGYHMIQILSLLEYYHKGMVEDAIQRATSYNAYGCSTIRNICRQGEILEPRRVEVELTQRAPSISESVEERALSYYSQEG